MKKIIIILLLAVSTVVLASPGAGGMIPEVSLFLSQLETKTIGIEWTQNLISDFTGWKLYTGEIQGGPYNHTADIPFVQEQTEYESSQIITLSSGDTIYLVLTSYNTIGESGYSNEAFKCFQIPDPPFILRIRVVVQDSPFPFPLPFP